MNRQRFINLYKFCRSSNAECGDGYHDDEDVGDVESRSSGRVRATRKGRMSVHFGRVSLVELVHHAVECLDFLVQSPLLLVHERLHVDRRRLLVVVF